MPALDLVTAATPAATTTSRDNSNNHNNNSSASGNSKTQLTAAIATAITAATATSAIEKTPTPVQSLSSFEASNVQHVNHGYKHAHPQNIATPPIISSLSMTNISAHIISPSLAPLSSSQYPPHAHAHTPASAPAQAPVSVPTPTQSHNYHHPSSVLHPLPGLTLPALQTGHSLPPTQSPPPQGMGAAAGIATATPTPNPNPNATGVSTNAMTLPHITTLPAPVATNVFHPYHPSFIQNIANVQFASPTYLGQYTAAYHPPSLQPQSSLDPFYELQRTNQELRDELRMAYNSIEILKSQINQLEDKEKDRDRDRDLSRRNPNQSPNLNVAPSAPSPLGQTVVHHRSLDIGSPYLAASNAQPLLAGAGAAAGTGAPPSQPPPSHHQTFHYDFNALQKSQPRYWTPDEHQRFLEALEKYGSKDVRAIANHVRTRNATQVRTHAQKYFLRVAKESKEHIILNDSKQRSMSEGDLTRMGRQLVSRKQSYRPEGQGDDQDQDQDHDQDHDKGEDAQIKYQVEDANSQPVVKEAEQPAAETQPKPEAGSATSPSGPVSHNESLAKPAVHSASPVRNANGESSSSQVKVGGSEKRSPILQGPEQYHAHHIHVHQQQQQAGQHQGSGTSSSVSNPRAGGINLLSFVASSRDNPPPRG